MTESRLGSLQRSVHCVQATVRCRSSLQIFDACFGQVHDGAIFFYALKKIYDTFIVFDRGQSITKVLELFRLDILGFSLCQIRVIRFHPGQRAAFRSVHFNLIFEPGNFVLVRTILEFGLVGVDVF